MFKEEGLLANIVIFAICLFVFSGIVNWFVKNKTTHKPHTEQSTHKCHDKW